MAIVFLGTAAHVSDADYVAADTQLKLFWSTHRSVRVADFGDSSGRKWMKVPSTDNLGMALASPTITVVTEVWIGVRLKINALPASGVEPWIMSLLSGGSTTVTLQLTPAGKILVKQFDDSTQAYLSSGTPIPSGAGTYYIEMRYKRNGTGGAGTATIDVYINGVLDGTATVSTGVGWGDVDQGVWARGANNADDEWPTAYEMADMYLDTTTRFTSRANAQDGPRITYVVPTGAPVANWTPNTGTNEGAVDELDGDGDTTYNGSSTNTQRDEYTHGGLPTNYTIYALRGGYRMRSPGGASTCNFGIKSSSTDDIVSRATAAAYSTTRAPTSYSEVDPATSAAWTITNFNALRIVIAMNTAVAHRVTQVGLVVAYVGQIVGGTIASTFTLYPPTVGQKVIGATIASTFTLYPPTVGQKVSGATIASTFVLYPPSIALPDQPTIEATATGPRSITTVVSDYSNPGGNPVGVIEIRRGTVGMGAILETLVIEFASPADVPTPFEYEWTEDIDPATQYCFDARWADDQGQYGPRSTSDCATTPAETPANTPTILAANPGATFVSLTGSAFSDSLGREHVMTRWQVDIAAGNFSTPVNENLSDIDGLTSETLLGLTPATAYKARVQYVTEDNAETAWSPAKNFTTLSVPTDRPAQPSIVIDQVTQTSFRLTLEFAYSDPDDSPHFRTRWYVTNYPGGGTFGIAYRFKDILAAVQLTQITITGASPGTLYNATAFLQAADGDWSDQAPWEPVTTLDAPLGGDLLQIQQPRQGETVRGTTAVEWTPAEDDGTTFQLWFSDDRGATWTLIDDAISGSPYSWDTTDFDDGVGVLRLRAEEDGQFTGYEYRLVYIDNANKQAAGKEVFNTNAEDPMEIGDFDPAWNEASVVWSGGTGGDVRFNAPSTSIFESALRYLPAFEPRQVRVLGEFMIGSTGGALPVKWFPEQCKAGVGVFAVGGVGSVGPLDGIALMAYALPITVYGDCNVRGSGTAHLELAVYENGQRIKTAANNSLGRLHVRNTFAGCNKNPRYGVDLFLTTIATLGDGRRRLRIQGNLWGRGITPPPDGGWHIETTVETGLDCGMAAFVANQITQTNNAYRSFSNLTVLAYEYGSCSAPPGFDTPVPEELCPVPFFDLTIFGDDDATPVFGSVDEYGVIQESSFSTLKDHPRPWLIKWQAGSEHEVDPISASSSIGSLSAEVVDKRTDPCDQGTGYLTGFAGDGDGFSAYIGRRAIARERLRDGSVHIIQDGPITEVTLLDNLSAYRLTVSSMREREREVPLFDTQYETLVAHPWGPTSGYGATGVVDGETTWLVPPVLSLFGIYEEVTVAGGIQFGRIVVPPAFGYYVRNELEALGDHVPDFDETGYIGEFYSQVIVRWRPLGGDDDDWVYLRNMPAGGVANSGNLFQDMENSGDQSEVLEGWRFVTIGAIKVNAYVADAPTLLPADDDEIEYQVLANSTPSEAFPFFYDGNMGTLLRRIYDGAYSPSAPNILYDEDCMAVLEDQAPIGAKLRKFESADDIRSWVEANIYQAIGWLPALNEDGAICPIDAAPPDGDAILVTLDADLVIGKAGYSQDGSRAVPVASYRFAREYRQGVGYPDVWELTSQPVEVIRVSARAGALLRSKALILEPETIRSVSDSNAELNNEAATQLAINRATALVDTFAFGPQIVTVRVRDTVVTRELRVGTWVIVDLEYIPNLVMNRRGGPQMGLITRRQKDPGLAWDLSIILSGSGLPGLEAPTIGTPAVGDDNIVCVDVDIPGAEDYGTRVYVEYGYGTTQPTAWTFAGYGPGTVCIPSQTSGVTVWFRAKTILAGYRDSGWVYSDPVAVNDTNPALYSLAVFLAFDGTPTVSWTASPITLGVLIEWSVETPPAGPSYANDEEVDATLGEFELATTVSPGDRVSVKATPYTGYSMGAVSGTPGTTLFTSADME